MWIRPRVCSYGNRWCWNPSGNLIRRWTPTFRTLCRLGQTFASVCSPLRTLRKLTTTSRAAVTRRNPLQALNQATSTSARDSTGRKKPLLGSRPSLCDPSYCSAGWPWVTVGAAQVEEVSVNKGDDILEEVGCLDGDRGQVRRLPRWRGSERSCGRLLPEDFTRRASELFAGALDRRLDDEVARVRGARDTRFPLERRLDRHGVFDRRHGPDGELDLGGRGFRTRAAGYPGPVMADGCCGRGGRSGSRHDLRDGGQPAHRCEHPGRHAERDGTAILASDGIVSPLWQREVGYYPAAPALRSRDRLVAQPEGNGRVELRAQRSPADDAARSRRRVPHPSEHRLLAASGRRQYEQLTAGASERTGTTLAPGVRGCGPPRPRRRS